MKSKIGKAQVKKRRSALLSQYDRGNVLSDKCPSRRVLSHVTSRWGVLVLLALRDGDNHRYSALRRQIAGISEKMLAQTLHQLESNGFVLRTAFPVVPPHVEYALTELGQGMAARISELTDWIESNIHDIVAASNSEQQAQFAEEMQK